MMFHVVHSKCFYFITYFIIITMTPLLPFSPNQPSFAIPLFLLIIIIIKYYYYYSPSSSSRAHKLVVFARGSKKGFGRYTSFSLSQLCCFRVTNVLKGT